MSRALLVLLPAAFFWLAVVTPLEPAEEGRVYHQVAIDDMPTTIHTHVCVSGQVALLKREADKDWHIKLQDPKGTFIVAEEIPSLKARGQRPTKAGQWITVCGISRQDKKHGWYEVHPIEEYRP